MSSSVGEDGKSAELDCAAPAGTNEPPSAPSLRLSRNCTDCAITSTFDRLPPSCDSHDDQSSRPSTPMRRPLPRCCESISAWFPNTFTSKKFGLSTHWPLWSCLRPLTARPSSSTALPDGRCLSSGSRVSRPTSVTRLISPAISPHPPLRDRRSRHRDSPEPPREVAPPDLPRDDVSQGGASRCRRS